VYQEQLMFAVMNLAGYTAPEADDLRKAISKKQKEKLLKHREKFISGATERDIAEETARKIFDEWEEFARYGFNKAHAADYGVLAVQTAYLKTHYPVEYMTAVLSVNQNDTSKVALYAADCRRMGIKVAPPDVNISAWDFSIEDLPDGKAAIRFGLGAVKNVGRAPVDIIIEGRQKEGPFENINDFAHRVDLRHVGKRALECLVRVGAMDRFGPRPALLQSLDRLVSFSAAHFQAEEVGQISFFGGQTGLQEEFSLPDITGEVTHREQLDWERELIGLYVSDHPLNPVMDVLNEIVTHFSAQLSEANPKETVRVAGMITRFRTHQTRKGSIMGFATLEDIQGEIELVIFPRTWKKVSSLIEVDKLIVVEGRVDEESSEPKLLVNTIKTDLKITTARDPLPPAQLGTAPAVEPRMEEITEPSKQEETSAYSDDTVSQGEVDPHTSAAVAETSKAYSAEPSPDRAIDEDQPVADWDEEDQEVPPQPDIFPPNWELASAVISAVKNPEAAIDLAEASSEGTPQPAPERSGTEPLPDTKIPGGSGPGLQSPGEEAPAESTPALPPFIISPLPPTEGDQIQMITIVLRSSHDTVRDNLRIRQIYGTLIAYPGQDRFAFHVFERDHGYLIEFPNFTTQLCPELLSRLKSFVPQDQLRIEPITFQ
jgi:DNA polymerase-3 subunit alpha